MTDPSTPPQSEPRFFGDISRTKFHRSQSARRGGAALVGLALNLAREVGHDWNRQSHAEPRGRSGVVVVVVAAVRRRG